MNATSSIMTAAKLIEALVARLDDRINVFQDEGEADKAVPYSKAMKRLVVDVLHEEDALSRHRPR
jgi:hypothetical protein